MQLLNVLSDWTHAKVRINMVNLITEAEKKTIFYRVSNQLMEKTMMIFQLIDGFLCKKNGCVWAGVIGHIG